MIIIMRTQRTEVFYYVSYIFRPPFPRTVPGPHHILIDGLPGRSRHPACLPAPTKTNVKNNNYHNNHNVKLQYYYYNYYYENLFLLQKSISFFQIFFKASQKNKKKSSKADVRVLYRVLCSYCTYHISYP